MITVSLLSISPSYLWLDSFPLNHLPNCLHPSKQVRMAVCWSLVINRWFEREDCNTSACPPTPILKIVDCFLPMEATTIDAIVHYVDAERNHADVSNICVDYGGQTFSNSLFWLSSTLWVCLSSSFFYQCPRTDKCFDSFCRSPCWYDISILSLSDQSKLIMTIRSCTIMCSLCLKRSG
jgi:hypothetical protein